RIVACFAADAEFHHDGGAPVQGTDELRAFFAEALTHPRTGNAGTSTHMIINIVIELEGDHGLVQTSAIACLASQGRNSVVLRGLRYNDECVRTSEGWRIARRQHRCLWECEAPGGVVDNRL
ncbi:MAG TPA: nuclear transport factor 2 family protein, partial [Acidimicrobiales bacterium]|nr:nuclear transport factor 2 family protein [Acidimicrobiales bacterium]